MSAKRLQRILLLLQRGVEAKPVENPWDDDVVGDAGLGEFAVPVDAELVDADGLELERLVRAAVFGPQRVELADRLGQLLARHHRAGPAVADAGGPPQRHIGVAADVERHRLRRRGAHLQLVEVEELAVELDHAAAEDQLDHLDHLVDPGTARSCTAPRTIRIPRVPSRFRRRSRSGCSVRLATEPTWRASSSGLREPSFMTLV